MAKYFQVTIIYGSELQAKSKFPEVYTLYNDSNSLITGDEYFPYTIVSTGDFITIPLKFGKDQNFKEISMDICSKLEVDAIAFSSLHLWVFSAKGRSNPLSLTSYLYIIDKEGNLIVSDLAQSKDSEIAGDNIYDYILKLDDYGFVLDKLVEKAASKYFKKKK